MGSIKFKLEGADMFKEYIAQASAEKKRQCEVLVAETALKMQGEAMKNLASNRSVKTGSLVKSIRVYPGGLTASVETNIDYASYVEYGTPAHVIMPKNGKALAFRIGGKDIIVKKVNHPGTKPKPFFGPAFETARNYFLTNLNSIVNG